MKLIDLTPLINSAIVILAAIITPRVLAWLHARTNAEQREDLIAWVKITVAAAEQLYDSAHGREKKEYVLGLIRERGFDVDTKELDSTIEAAVLTLHNGLKDGGGDGNG